MAPRTKPVVSDDPPASDPSLEEQPPVEGEASASGAPPEQPSTAQAVADAGEAALAETRRLEEARAAISAPADPVPVTSKAGWQRVEQKIGDEIAIGWRCSECKQIRWGGNEPEPCDHAV